MKLPWPLVEAHESVQDNMDALASALPNTPLMQTFIQLASGASRKIAFGTTSLTWTAAAQSAVRTVTHGLGVTPLVVLLTFKTSGVVITPHHQNETTTTFDAFGNATAAITATVNLDWLAIG
jgi:hypothetical protein